MCVSKKELESIVKEFRSLKAMSAEIEEMLKSVEHEIIAYMNEHEIDTEFTSDAKITYKPQCRKMLDAEKLAAILGDDLEPYKKTTKYNVLRIK